MVGGANPTSGLQWLCQLTHRVRLCAAGPPRPNSWTALRTPKTTSPETMRIHPAIRCAGVNGKRALSLIQVASAQTRAAVSVSETATCAARQGATPGAGALPASGSPAPLPPAPLASCTVSRTTAGF